MKRLIVIFILVPVFTFAQSAGQIIVGEVTVSYDSVFELENAILYYQAEELVASKHEEVTLVYQDDVVFLEAYDTNESGESDTFVTLNAQGEIAEVAGEGVELFERPATVEFADLLQNVKGEGGAVVSEEDLVGSLDSITIPRYHNYTLYGLASLLLIGAGFWWYKRHRRQTD